MKKIIILIEMLLCLCLAFGSNVPAKDDPGYTVEELYDPQICKVYTSFYDDYNSGGIERIIDNDSIVIETTGPCYSINVSIYIPGNLFDLSSDHQITFDVSATDENDDYDIPYVMSYRFDRYHWDSTTTSRIAYFDNIAVDSESRSYAYDLESSEFYYNYVRLSIELRTGWTNYYLPKDVHFKVTNISFKRYTKIPVWTTLDVSAYDSLKDAYTVEQEHLSQAEFLKIKGQLSETDLAMLRELTNVIKLDLSQSQIDELPAYFLYSTSGSDRPKLDELWLPQNIDSIPDKAFYNNTRLKCVHSTPPRYIGNNAFAGTNLNEIDLSRAYYIGESAFAYANLQTLSLPDGIETIFKETFRNNCYLRQAHIGEGIRAIWSYAFGCCHNLKEINFPDGLLHIGSHALDHTAIKDITLPYSLELAANDICTNSGLCITLLAPAPPGTKSGKIFGNSVKELRVPSGSLKTYGSTPYWEDFNLLPIDTIIGDFSVVRQANLSLSLKQDYKPKVGLKHIQLYNYDKQFDMDNDYSSITSTGELTLGSDSHCAFSEFAITTGPRLTRDMLRSYINNDSGVGTIPTLINNSDGITVETVTLKMSVRTKTWYFISLPFKCNVMDITPATNVMWTIRKYDSYARATGNIQSAWVTLDAGESLMPYQGYILSAIEGNKDASEAELTFRSSNAKTLLDSGDRNVTLSEYDSEFIQNRSWNFIGNPYPSYYNMHFVTDGTGEEFTAPITIWRGSSYTAYSPLDDDIILLPYEAFFVQCPAADTKMVFGRDGRMHHSEAEKATQNNGFGVANGAVPGSKSPARSCVSDREVFNFNLSLTSAETVYNRARIILNESASQDYEIDKDALKFMDTADDAPLIYIADGINYEICERPYGDGTASLTVSTPASGQYVLDLTGRYSSDWQVLLTDLMTGVSVDLTQQSYTFTSDYQTSDRKFMVTFDNQRRTDGISELTGHDVDNDVTVISPLGVVVYSGPLSGFRCHVPGTYIIQSKNRTFKKVIK